MLSCNLTEIKLADLKNLSLFLIKTNIIKIHRQQKLSTKRVDSLSFNSSENKLRPLLMRLIHKTIKNIKNKRN